MKNILLATDLASETDRALERAIRLASTMKSRLHVLHVCAPYEYPGSTLLANAPKLEAQDRLEKYLSGNHLLHELHPNISVIESREPFIEIIKQAEKVDAELIVMGMHGKAKLRDLFVGTTIEKVIRKGVRPVLMVKDKPTGEYTTLLVGTDFSAECGEALQITQALSPNGSIHLVHFCGIPDTYIGDKIRQYAGNAFNATAKATLKAFVQKYSKDLMALAGQPQKFQYRIIQGKAIAGLNREVAEHNADLIAIGVHHQSSFLPYRVGGTAGEILTNPPCDVLVAKEIYLEPETKK